MLVVVGVATARRGVAAACRDSQHSRQTDSRRTTVYYYCCQALQALVGIPVRARADLIQLGVSGVWRRTHGRCLLARSLACLLAGLLRVCGPGGCRERWSSVQQVPAAVWRDEGRSARLRRGEQSAVQAGKQVRLRGIWLDMRVFRQSHGRVVGL